PDALVKLVDGLGQYQDAHRVQAISLGPWYGDHSDSEVPGHRRRSAGPGRLACQGGERMKPQLVIVGNSVCRRVGFWRVAACPPPRLVADGDLLAGRARLADHLSAATVVRFESLAENWETMQLLLKHGQAAAVAEGYPALDDGTIDGLRQERGWVVAPRQGYL